MQYTDVFCGDWKVVAVLAQWKVLFRLHACTREWSVSEGEMRIIVR